MKMCPKEIKHMLEISWDTIQERYEVMKEKVIVWATNAAEKVGGPVPMEVDAVVEGWDGEEWGEEWYDCEEQVGAVYPNTVCYQCWGYGHMARECQERAKERAWRRAKVKAKGRTEAKARGRLMVRVASVKE